MRQGSGLRRFLLANLRTYHSLRDLASAAEALAADDADGSRVIRCRECGKEGHMARECPRKKRSIRSSATSANRTAAAAAEAELET